MDLKRWIRDVPDYPSPGILFRDLTPLWAHPPAYRYAVDQIAAYCRERAPDAVAAIDARGFLFGGPVAVALSVPLIPLRKHHKLPPETVSLEYELEYGKDAIEARSDAIRDGMRVLVVDDLLATGGTAAAAAALIEKCGGRVTSFAFVVELTALNGRHALTPHDVFSLVQY